MPSNNIIISSLIYSSIYKNYNKFYLINKIITYAFICDYYKLPLKDFYS